MDQSLFHLINVTWTSPVLDLPMATLSSWDFWWPIAVVAGLLAFVLGGFRARVAIVCIGLAVGFTDGIVIRTLKGVVERPRPYQVLDGVRILDLQKAKPRLRALALAQPVKLEISEPSIQPVTGRAFPSGHAANNFALAVVLAVFYRRWGWLYFIPACLVAYSRVYVGSHYPVDVGVAALVGSACAFLVLALLEGIWRQLAPRAFPRLAERHPSLIAS
jgi:undecaprenyl-diphosphatase